MTQPDQIHTSFELAVMAGQIDRLEPKCDAADEIHGFALMALARHGVRTKTASGRRVLKTDGYPMAIAGYNVELNLMAEQGRFQTWEAWKVLFQVLLKGKYTPDFPITLAVNGNISQQAALILPPTEARTSAFVVVGHSFNDPEHLAAILPVVRTLARAPQEIP